MKPWVIIFLVACGSLTPQPVDPLDDAIRQYNDGVRWGRYETAATRIAPKERAQFVNDADERSKDLRITQYDIVQVERRGARAANVHVKIEWYKDNEGTLRETHAKQTWEKHGGTWLMVQEARLRGHEMPGLPEPVPSTGSEPAAPTGPEPVAPTTKPAVAPATPAPGALGANGLKGS